MILLALGCGELVEQNYGGGELLIWPSTPDQGQGEIRVAGLDQAQLDHEAELTGSYAWVTGTDDEAFSVNWVLAEGELEPWLPCDLSDSFFDGTVYEDRLWIDGTVAMDGRSGDVRGWSGDPSFGPDTSRLEGSASAQLETVTDVGVDCDDVETELTLTLVWAFDEDVTNHRRETPDWLELELELPGLYFTW